MHTVLMLGLLAAGQSTSDEEHRKKTILDFSDVAIEGQLVAPDGAYLSARPGGAQDADYFRARALAGEVPRPEAITAEGLLSKHDLPLARPPACEVLLCPAAEAARVRLSSRPEVTHLVQVGFTSGIDASRFRRPPVNLIALVDRSGSMAGRPLQLVKETLGTIAARLGREDRLAVVVFADDAEVLQPPTNDGARIRRAIAGIESGGSTALEAGLRRAFALAASTRAFDGITRVMLFTDERPNVGRTDPAGFRAQAEEAARLGIGLTTIGVGVEFGVELATAVSSVRGGNLFYFADPAAMRERIEGELDSMITELGYDLELAVTPRSGMRIAGVYGVPDGVVRREGTAIVVRARTLFASRRRGAIFLAMAPSDAPLREEENGRLARLDLSFVEAGGARRHHRLAVEAAGRTPGLSRGELLVDAFVALRAAAERHHHLRDERGALAEIEVIAQRFREVVDRDLLEERRLVLALEETLRRITGTAEMGLDRRASLP